MKRAIIEESTPLLQEEKRRTDEAKQQQIYNPSSILALSQLNTFGYIKAVGLDSSRYHNQRLLPQHLDD